MNKYYIITASVLGALGVILGAFGAHSLKTILTSELLETYKTGVFYHIIHTVVLLALAIVSKYNFKIAYYFFLVGIILFSFSLYAYTITEVKYFALITPIGGISLILGWIFIGLSAYKSKS